MPLPPSLNLGEQVCVKNEMTIEFTAITRIKTRDSPFGYDQRRSLMCAKKRIVDPIVTTCSAPFPFTHMPFSDYNLN